MVINDIILRKKKDIEELKRRYPLHRLQNAVEMSSRQDKRDFKKAVSRSREINLICELKKASPSEGLLRPDFQPLRIASIYEHCGAAAISVLTETHYFKGRPSYLKTVRQVSKLPILRKDFIFESYQIYESSLLEADAYLLISSLLTPEELRDLIALGKKLNMHALVEVHTHEDLRKAVDAGAEIIGINNRNLKTLEVDKSHAKSLLKHIPKGIPVIVESGLHGYEDIVAYKTLGVNSFLIGTVLMKSSDIMEKLQEMLGQDRKWRKENAG